MHLNTKHFGVCKTKFFKKNILKHFWTAFSRFASHDKINIDKSEILASKQVKFTFYKTLQAPPQVKIILYLI